MAIDPKILAKYKAQPQQQATTTSRIDPAILAKYKNQVAPTAPQVPVQTELQKRFQQEGILGKTADIVDQSVEGFKQLPPVKYFGKGVGLATGLAGGLIGGSVGAVGTPIANIMQGKPLGTDFVKNVKSTATKTGGFGKYIGEEGGMNAPLAGAGKIPQAIMAAPLLYRGVVEKDPSKLALGVLSVFGIAKTKGNLIDESVIPKSKPKTTLPKVEKTMAKLESALPQTKSSINASQNFTSKHKESPVSYLNKNEIPITVKEKRIVVDKEATTKLREQLGEQRDEVLGRLKTPTTQKTELATLTKKNLEGVPLDTKMREEVDSFIDEVLGKEPENLSPADLTKLKTAWDRVVKYDKQTTPTQKQSAYQAMADAARELAIRDAIKANPYATNVLGALNKEFQKTYDLDKYIQSINGMSVKNGRIGGMFARLSGNVVGSKLGPVGSYLTGEAFEKLSTVLKNPERISSAVIKELQDAGSIPPYLATKEDVLYWADIMDILKQPKQLPVAQTPQFGNTPIKLPSARDAEIQTMRRNLAPTPFTPSPSGSGVPQVPVGVPVRQPIQLPQQNLN